MRSQRRGFTLIELLIVVAIIGIIVAIAIPNLLNAIQRAKQKRTMVDMRTIATAVEAYSTDWTMYPPITNIAALRGYVSPTYVKAMPQIDGWANTLIYATANGNTSYTITSYGRDGAAGFTPGIITNFNQDIVFADGQFLSYPDGAQN